MKNLLMTTALLVAIASCNKEEQEPKVVCTVEDPLIELTWLANELEDLKKSSFIKYYFISTAEYKGETVFIFGNCCPSCNSVIPVRNCEGDLLGILGNRPEDVDYQQLKENRFIWQGEEGQCELIPFI